MENQDKPEFEKFYESDYILKKALNNVIDRNQELNEEIKNLKIQIQDLKKRNFQLECSNAMQRVNNNIK